MCVDDGEVGGNKRPFRPYLLPSPRISLHPVHPAYPGNLASSSACVKIVDLARDLIRLSGLPTVPSVFAAAAA